MQSRVNELNVMATRWVENPINASLFLTVEIQSMACGLLTKKGRCIASTTF